MQTSDYTIDLQLHDGTDVIVKFDREVDYNLSENVYFYIPSRFHVYDSKGEHIVEVNKDDRDYIEEECYDYLREVNDY